MPSSINVRFGVFGGERVSSLNKQHKIKVAKATFFIVFHVTLSIILLISRVRTGMGKQQHLANRIANRSVNNSTAEQYGFSEVITLADQSQKELTKLPKCRACHGKGTHKPMFYEMECPECFGTALDLSEPLAIIKLQSSYLAQAKGVIVAQRQAMYELLHPEDERYEKSVKRFYDSMKKRD